MNLSTISRDIILRRRRALTKLRGRPLAKRNETKKKLRGHELNVPKEKKEKKKTKQQEKDKKLLGI